MVQVRCRGCFHWEPAEGESLGLCLLQPSKIECHPDNQKTRVFYRSTYADEYCDSFKADFKPKVGNDEN
jgi:hypothetical protein